MTSRLPKFAVAAQSAVLWLVSLATSTALAQGVSVFTGTVTDASSHQPLADAVVTATSPTFQGEQVAVTDATGVYRIPQLTPGLYTLRVEKEGYRPFSRGDIDVRADRTLRLNVELLPEAIKEEVIVVGRPPTVDVGSSTLSTNVTSDFVKNLALSPPTGRGGGQRSFESLALVAPTSQSDLYGISINGTTSPENGYLVDGLSVSNPAFGTLGSNITAEFMDEVNVITGGYLPEFGRSQGGVLSAVTKSGSNEFHGSIFGSWTPGSIQGTAKEVSRAGSSISFIPTLHNVGDIGATLGGPIVKDRLWFFAGIQPSAARFKLEKDFNRTTPGVPGVTKINGAEQFYFADRKSLNYIGKVTYLINPDNRVSLSVIGTPSISGHNGTYPFGANNGLPSLPIAAPGTFNSTSFRNDQGSTDVILKLASSFLEKHVLVDATLGYHHEYSGSLPVDGSALGSSDGLAGTPAVNWRRTAPHPITDFETNPALLAACDPPGTPRAVLCPVTTYRTGGTGFINQSTFDIWQGKLVGTYFGSALGHHVIKAGFDGKYLFYNRLKAYTGLVNYREATDGQSFADFREYGILAGPDDPVFSTTWSTKTKTYVVGGFVQNSWSILDAIVLNAGVRYDTQIAIGANNQEALRLPNQWSPRIGVVYDFTQQGRSKIYVNYSRFFEDIPLDAFDRQFPGERALSNNGRRSRTGARPGEAFCDPLTTPNDCRNPATLIATTSRTSPNRYWNPVGGDSSPVDPNLSAPSMEQIVMGFEYELFSSARLGASYMRQYITRAIEDMSRDEAATYFIGNPGYGFASDFPKAVRNYNAWTVYFNKVYANSWLAQVSYTYSTLVGNYQGLFLGTGQLDPNITSDFDLQSLLPNRHDRLGPLPADINHKFKFFTAKEFVLTGVTSFSVGLSYSGRSGGPIEYLGSHNVYGGSEVYILPRGSGGRLPWIHTIDPHLGFNYRMSKDSVLTLNVDAFNVFNFQRPTRVDNVYTVENVLPIPGGSPADLPGRLLRSDATPFPANAVSPNFKNPTEYQSPRSIRFGARLTF